MIGLLAPTLIAGWAPVLHWTCVREGEYQDAVVQIPALLINSPYGGSATGNVSYSKGFAPGGANGEGTQDSNGGAAWAGYQARVTVAHVGNATSWGPGANIRCQRSFDVEATATGNLSGGIPILGPGNISDDFEPMTVFPGYTAAVNIDFSNGFASSNHADVSTCGDSAKTIPVTSSRLTLWAQTVDEGTNVTAPLALPIGTLQYVYLFPANFGIWQVDNLSAPGGPGGGWAFSYSPCS
jgi:hypothetical protein